MKMNGEGNLFLVSLFSDCPTVTVNAEKRFQALIVSGVAFSSPHTSVYNMIKDFYKTKILPVAVQLKTADGSSMSSKQSNLTPLNYKF